MYKQLDCSLLLNWRQIIMPKKTVLVALLLVVCVTAVLLTALFRDSLCEFHYKGANNDLRMIFAYEVRS